MWKAPSILVGIVLLLLALGIVMLASASSVKGADVHTDPTYFLKRQVVFLAVALIAGWLAARVDYHAWQRHWILLAALSAALLLIVLIPHIGVKIGGSRRWLKLGGFSFQPSEFAKLAAVVMLSAWMTQAGRKASRFIEGIAKPGAMLAVLLGLIFAEPDFGTTILIAAVGFALLFVGGARPRYLAVTGTLGLAGFVVAVMHDPVRMGRILAFLMPEKYPAAAFQLGQSKVAFVLGGFGGCGLGESIQKRFYLPEAHTDFILAIIGEELGLVATVLVVALFAGVFACGMTIASRARDLYGRLLATGLTLTLVLQAVINVGVVTGCMPTKGLPLPFISYGGSSLVASTIAVGILISIARQGIPDDRHPGHTVRDGTQWV